MLTALGTDATTHAAYQTLESLVPASGHPIGLVNGIDWLAQQNGGQFDPVLFGDYREPQEAITSGDYGFFGDSFPRYDFGGPLNGGYPPSQTSTKITAHHQEVAEHPPAHAKPAMTAEEQSKVEVNCDTLWSARPSLFSLPIPVSPSRVPAECIFLAMAEADLPCSSQEPHTKQPSVPLGRARHR